MVGALMVTAFFVATEIAKAADVTFSGQVRTRYEVNEQHDFLDTSDADDFTSTRVRLNADVNVNDSTSAFIQLQDVRVWGGSNEVATAGTATPAGTGAGVGGAVDTDGTVGLHQAYFTLKNFATLPVDLKVGRQEVVLDGHRLFGNTNWAQGAVTHDAVRLDHKHDNMSLAYAWITVNEDGVPTGTNIDDRNDREAHLIYGAYEGLLGGKLSIIYTYINDGCGSGTACDNLANDLHNIGFRQAGQLYGVDYRAEYNYQWGDASSRAAVGALGTRAYVAGANVDRDAYMFGVRVGKSFNNVTMKPSLTVWYDYLSGTSDQDARDGEMKSFNTLFDTGHKFYGFMDLYGGVGNGAAIGAGNTGTAGLGLQDVAIKAKISPMPGWTLKADYHWFYTAEGVAGNSAAGLAGDGSQDNDLGNELDITIVNQYNANTNISLGFSNYTTTAAFRDLKGVTGDGANWAYLMFDVKF